MKKERDRDIRHRSCNRTVVYKAMQALVPVESISIEGRSEKYPSNTHSDKKHSYKRTGWRRGVSTYQKNTVLLQKRSI